MIGYAPYPGDELDYSILSDLIRTSSPGAIDFPFFSNREESNYKPIVDY
jgi:hypothetical protein